ncbi:hypothetical protein, partial [Pseudomonas aeruginosa]
MPPIDDPFGTPAGGGNGSPPDDRTMICLLYTSPSPRDA